LVFGKSGNKTKNFAIFANLQKIFRFRFFAGNFSAFSKALWKRIQKFKFAREIFKKWKFSGFSKFPIFAKNFRGGEKTLSKLLGFWKKWKNFREKLKILKFAKITKIFGFSVVHVRGTPTESTILAQIFRGFPKFPKFYENFSPPRKKYK